MGVANELTVPSRTIRSKPLFAQTTLRIFAPVPLGGPISNAHVKFVSTGLKISRGEKKSPQFCIFA